jgi:uncharacterized protein (DUF58 family)
MLKNILDPKLLLNLFSLSLRAKMVVEGILSGIHSSKYKGFSLDFSHHREYTIGDELRFIDWKIYGKSDKYVVKQFREDTSLKAYILLDISKSMNYTGDEKNIIKKIEYAQILSAALSYLMISQHDSVGMFLFDSKIQKIIPSDRGYNHLHYIFHELENIKIQNESQIYNSLLEFGKYLKRRSLIIIISDLLEEKEKLWDMIKHLRASKHEIILFHVLDKKELFLDQAGKMEFVDIESEDKDIIYADDIKDEYSEIVKEFLSFYKDKCRKFNIDYHLFTTDIPIAKALTFYLSMREKMQ